MCDRRVLEALGHDSLVDLSLRQGELLEELTTVVEGLRAEMLGLTDHAERGWDEAQRLQGVLRCHGVQDPDEVPPLGVSQAQVDQAHWHGIHRVPSMEEAARGAQRLAKAGPSVAQVEARLGMTPQRNNAATPEQYPNHPDAPHSAEQERTHD